MNGGDIRYPLWLSRRKAVHYSFLFLLLSSPLPIAIANATATTSGNLGSRWTTDVINNGNSSFLPILVAGGGAARGPVFAFGFFKVAFGGGILLALSLILRDANYSSISTAILPELVWVANRDKPAYGFTALDLTVDGDLRLSDQDGSLLWSTNTSFRGVTSLNLTVEGNLALFNASGRSVWQSYDHPTDTALRNQSLVGKTLVANASAANSSEGSFYFNVYLSVYEAYFIVDNGSPAQMYYRVDLNSSQTSSPFKDGVLLPLDNNSKSNWANRGSQEGRALINTSWISTSQPSGIPRKHYPPGKSFDPSIFAEGFVRLEADGRLIEYTWEPEILKWHPLQSLLDDGRGPCGYPNVCGRYGICSEGECSCPQEAETGTTYFQPMNNRKPNQGCKLMTDLTSCKEHELLDPRQKMMLYDGISYFGYVQQADKMGVTLEICKQACARDCSCKAAFFKYGLNNSNGDCYLVSTVFSIIENHPNVSNYNSTAFLKVQLPDAQEAQGRQSHLKVALIISVTGVLSLIVFCSGYVLYRRKKKVTAKAREAEDEDDILLQFEHLPGMPTKLTYKELKEATGNFSNKLGEGGFGAVFKGTLRDNTQVAVKTLGPRGQGVKEFLAEVQTIGSVHHVNLVRLVGYCAERLHCMLVYEYLSNGSLDKWVFHDNATGNNNEPLLGWCTKMKIILQVAKGLSYLHEECRHRIIHLDIKPPNILLDDNFNAKVSDFGLSKLVDRDQSKVMTTLRGTPGYMAPEWLDNIITEKVDVYSFGVLVLETVSGKKVIDYSRSPESINLLSLLRKAETEEQLLAVIGSDNNREEATRLVKIAMWCLQTDFTNRPSMSVVVKALEEGMEIEPTVNIGISSADFMSAESSSRGDSIPMLSCVSTEPR